MVESEDGEDAEFDEDFDHKEADEDEEEKSKHEKKLKPWELRMRNRILPKAFQRWRGMAEASRNAYMSSRGFTLPPEAPKDCMLTTSASSLLLCMPRALRLIRAEEARRERQRELDKLQPRAKAPKPKPPPVLAGFGSKLASMNSELVATSLTKPEPAACALPGFRSRTKLELLAQEAADSSPTEQLSLREQLQALTHTLHVEEALPADAPDLLRAGTPSSNESGAYDDSDEDAEAMDEPKPPLDIERVWVTMMVLSVLERFGESALFSADDDPQERTIVDAGHLYLEKMARHYPSLAKALEMVGR
jgi:hypothetical protein